MCVGSYLKQNYEMLAEWARSLFKQRRGLPVILPETIVRRRCAALIPYARNARTHSDQQVAQIAASIREFGCTNPVLIGEEDGIIGVRLPEAGSTVYGSMMGIGRHVTVLGAFQDSPTMLR